MLTEEYLQQIREEQDQDKRLAIKHARNTAAIVFRQLSPKLLAMYDDKALDLYREIEKAINGAPCVYMFKYSKGHYLTGGQITLQEAVNRKSTTPRLNSKRENATAIYIGSSLNMADRAIRHIRENGIKKGRGANKVLSLGAPHKGTCLRMNKWLDGLVDLVILPMPGTGKYGINFIEEIYKAKYGTLFGRKEN